VNSTGTTERARSSQKRSTATVVPVEIPNSSVPPAMTTCTLASAPSLPATLPSAMAPAADGPPATTSAATASAAPPTRRSTASR